MKRTPTAARYEASTRTIRSVPENYWLASMDSWDGAVDSGATARIFAVAPEMLNVLRELSSWLVCPDTSPETVEHIKSVVDRVINKATGDR